MRLAFLLYTYHPYGGRQRCLRLLVEELKQRGHHCRVYSLSWQGEALAGVDFRLVPARALSPHRREQRFLDWVRTDLSRDPVEGVIGFNKVPDLDIYFAVDGCYLEDAPSKMGFFHRWRAHKRHFADWERAVFAPRSDTHAIFTVASARDSYRQRYNTPEPRMHLVPPGVTPDRRAPQDASRRRKAVRTSLELEPQEFALLFVGSDFAAKGLDRAITALAQLRAEQPSVKSRLLVVGQDKPRPYQRFARRLGVADGVLFLGGRDDIADLMLGADLLVHPARIELAGTVLLEALASGLPAVVTEVCGYAEHVGAARAGILLPSPFSQEGMDRAVMRYIDGIYRADCRESALLYARMTDLYSMYREGADLIEQLINNPQRPAEH